MVKSLLVSVFIFAVVVSTGVSAAEIVNINTDDKATLTTLVGIGDVKAQAIIDYRTSNGLFTKIEDIMNVSGIGTATYNNIKDFITVGSGTQQQTTQSEGTSSQATTSSQSENQNTSASTPVSSYVAPPVPQVFADAGSDRVVIVGADTIFSGRAYNRKKESVDHVRFMWNFGDGSTAEGPNVQHHYTYPGRYAVVLDIAQNTESVSDRFVVTAEPAKLAFTVPSDGSVAIENHAGRDLDLSGWIVRQYGQSLTLPDHSVILSGEIMRIPQTTLKFWSSAQAELAYPNGVVVLHANERSGAVVAPTPIETPSPAAAPVERPRASVVSAPLVENTREQDSSNSQRSDTAAESQVAAVASGISEQGGSTYWWIGAGALGVLGAAAVFIIRRVKSGEWDIIEET